MLQQYLTELQKINLLEREEELDLWRACADGDQSAYRKIITAYQPLVFKIAMAFRLTETQTLELIQEGTVGLLEAAEKFDYTRGVAFSIFASHRIRGRMLDFLQAEYGSQMLSLDGVNSAGLAWSECLVLFILAVAITRYVSLGSILVVISFLIQAIVFNHMGLLGVSGNYAVEFDILAACFTAMAIWRHRANIKRLLSGTENKFGQKAK